jgi:hypothetical protein
MALKDLRPELVLQVVDGTATVERTNLKRSYICRKLIDAGIIPETKIKDFFPSPRREFILPHGSVLARESVWTGIWLIVGPNARKDKKWLREERTNHTKERRERDRRWELQREYQRDRLAGRTWR